MGDDVDKHQDEKQRYVNVAFLDCILVFLFLLILIIIIFNDIKAKCYSDYNGVIGEH